MLRFDSNLITSLHGAECQHRREGNISCINMRSNELQGFGQTSNDVNVEALLRASIISVNMSNLRQNHKVVQTCWNGDPSCTFSHFSLDTWPATFLWHSPTHEVWRTLWLWTPFSRKNIYSRWKEVEDLMANEWGQHSLVPQFWNKKIEIFQLRAQKNLTWCKLGWLCPSQEGSSMAAAPGLPGGEPHLTTLTTNGQQPGFGSSPRCFRLWMGCWGLANRVCEVTLIFRFRSILKSIKELARSK